jgi:hypothetical protein
MSLFHKTLQDALAKARAGDIKGARKILSDHRNQQVSALATGTIRRLMAALNEYEEELNAAGEERDLHVFIQRVERAIAALNAIKLNVQKLVTDKKLLE